jgi:Tol biopolymer transport system component
MSHCMRRRPSHASAVASSERRALWTVALGLSLLALPALFVAPASGASKKTRIVWSRSGRPRIGQQLVSSRPDGSHLRALTRPDPDTQDIDASISPDGTRIAFERDLNSGETSEIALMRANGGNVHSLDLGCIDPCVADVTPTWTPAGDRIAFTPVLGPFDQPNDSATSAVLHTARINGSNFRRLSQPGIDGRLEDYHARFSPDGSYVVFTRIRNADLHVAIFRMDADGSHVRRLTPWKLDADVADLSLATKGPTKNLIAFETYGMGPPKGKSANVATVPSSCNPASGCRKQIDYVTHHRDGKVSSFNPSWSPNGRRIAYTRFKDHPCCLGDIWTSRPDGSHRKPVSKSPLFEYRPDWGPAPRR